MKFNERLPITISLENDSFCSRTPTKSYNENDIPAAEEDDSPLEVSQVLAEEQEVETQEQEEESLISQKRKPGRPAGVSNKPKAPHMPHPMTTRNRAMLVMRDPSTVEEAMTQTDKAQWQTAMKDELDSLHKNETWQLVPLPRGRKTIKNKWVLKRKWNPDGSLNKHKARLVAKGYSQREGVDYHETFAPVVRYDSIRSILAVAAYKDMEIAQFDVKTAFLHGELKEEIFMDQPEGFEDGSDRVCFLKKGLYGLKQSPRAWNQKFDNFLKTHGLKRSEADHCVYTSDTVANGRVILALYVDDGLLCCTSIATKEKILQELSSTFEITVGDPNYYVGLEIRRDRENKRIKINQNRYIKTILERFGMTDSKAVRSPGDPSNKVSKEMEPTTLVEKEQMEKVPYREAVGCLMFLMKGTRPDISYEVTRMAQFNENPGQSHWMAVKRIMRYLKGSMHLSLVFGPPATNSGSVDDLQNENLSLLAFCDSDWAGNIDNRRSTSGGIFLINNGPVVWTTREQKTVAHSSTEAEYMALSDATKEIKWLRQLLQDLGWQQNSATLLKSDNQGAIHLSKNPEYHKRTKHIDYRYHYIQQEQENGSIKIEYVATDKQPADMLTKSLSGPALERCKLQCNLCDIQELEGVFEVNS